MGVVSPSTPAPPPTSQLAWGHWSSDSSCKRGHSNSPPLMTDRLRGRKTNFHRQNDLLPLSQLSFRPPPPVFPTFRIDRRRLIERDGESNGLPDVHAAALCRCWDGGSGRSRRLVPPDLGGGWGAASSCWKSGFSRCFPTGSRWFPVAAVIWTDCCHQPGCGPHCLQRSEHFHASQHSLSHPSPR